jgi:signal transduction histidine kinase
VWTKGIVDGFEKVLNQKNEKRFELLIEYMDSKRYKYKDIEKQLFEIYKYKYKNKVDFIVTTDNNAMDFVKKYREKLFSNVPVIFCGFNEFKRDYIKNVNKISGIVEDLSVKETIDLALKVNKNLKKIYIISDLTASGIKDYDKYIKVKKKFPNINFVELINLSKADLIKRISKIDSNDSAVLFFSFHLDKDGKFYDLAESYQLISENASCLVYSFWEHNLEYGIAGGDLIYAQDIGPMVYKLILKAMDNRYEIIEKSPNRSILKYDVLKKFNQWNESFKKEHLIINYPNSIFLKYKKFFIVITLIFLIQFIIILLFYIRNIKKEYIQKKLTIEKDEAIQANKMKSEFLAVMSHELKTPLNSVIGYSKMLDCEKLIDIKRKDYLEKIVRNSMKLNDLITNILDLSKIESGNIDINNEEFNIQKLIDEIISTIQLDMKINDNTIKKVYNNIDVIKSDKTYIYHIIQNLLSNSIKFSEKCKINIEMKKENSDLLIIIKDCGIGINEENIKQIFLPFKQLNATYSRLYEGTGLGLYIVKKYVEFLNGTIDVQSEVNVGTTFTVRIPIA